MSSTHRGLLRCSASALMRSGLAQTVAILTVAACGGSPDALPDDDTGPLVIVGGALSGDNGAVYHSVLEARSGNGPFCVVPTASGVPEESMNASIERFSHYAEDPRYDADRPEVTGIWITTENPEAASDPAVVTQIAACSGYWFVGGSQSRIIETFRPASGDTPGYEALMGRWRAGAVVAGTSAGAAMMSSRSIGGGSPAAALEHGVTRDEDGEGVWVLPGMDFVPWAIVGQHHLARGRWGRLVVATLEGEDVLGLGIDENTAFVYDDGVGKVVGASSVLMIDVTDAARGAMPRTAEGIRLELLGTGDRLDVETLEVTRASGGKAGAPAPEAPATTDAFPGGSAAVPTLDAIAADPFARWTFLHLLHAFAAGTVDEITLDGGARALTLRAGDGFVGQAFADSGTVSGAGTPSGLSLGPLVLGITP